MRFLLALVASAGLFPAVAAAQVAPPAAPLPPTWPDGASPSAAPSAQAAPPGARPPPTLPDRPPPPAAATPALPRRLAVLSATITPLATPWELFEITRPSLFPVAALSLELRAHPRLGIAVMGMAGDNTDTNGDVKNHDTLYEIGAEPRWYLSGGFRGAMAGIAVHYFRMHMVLTDPSGLFAPFDFAGYTYGPFLGYKYTAAIGFTVEAKVGAELIKRTLSDRGSHPDILPMTDVKVGWSF
jgi:hypothetical protein